LVPSTPPSRLCGVGFAVEGCPGFRAAPETGAIRFRNFAQGWFAIVLSLFGNGAHEQTMILPQTSMQTLMLMIVSLVCLGSWAVTLKVAGKWRFELYCLDFALGAVIAAVTRRGRAALAGAEIRQGCLIRRALRFPSFRTRV